MTGTGTDAPRPEVVRRRAVRRAAGFVAGSGLALVGLVALFALWLGVAAGAVGDAAGDPCVTAAAVSEGDARVTYPVLPARAVCTWTVDGRTTRTVLAQAPAGVSVAAAAAAGAGLGTVALVAIRSRRRA